CRIEPALSCTDIHYSHPATLSTIFPIVCLPSRRRCAFSASARGRARSIRNLSHPSLRALKTSFDLRRRSSCVPVWLPRLPPERLIDLAPSEFGTIGSAVPLAEPKITICP